MGDAALWDARYRRLEERWARVAARFLPVTLADRPWRYSAGEGRDIPTEGWKLHLSATIRTAPALLSRTGPILECDGAMFKGPLNLSFLAHLNTGLDAYSQVGKCITVYCRDVRQARRLGRLLDAATAGLAHPEIPFDLRYGTGAVYYRYGSFHESGRGLIMGPRGRRVRDRREEGRAVPAWIQNPLPRAATPVSSASPDSADFRPVALVKRRGKGGVYLALNLRLAPARLAILKEGRLHGETDALGVDGRARVRREARTLRALRRAGVDVPVVLAEFDVGGHLFVAMEHIHGTPLSGVLAEFRPSKARRRQLDAALVELVEKIHSAGYAWRDLKPDNIMVTPDWRVRPLDFEGAWRRGEEPTVAWNTVGFAAPHRVRDLDPIAEDLYSLREVRALLI